MTESTQSDRRDEASDDLHDAAHDASRTADRTRDDLDDAATRTKDDAARVGHKVTDAVEDLIPGDSDGDGH
jgi:hypothetical protein